MEKRFEDFYKAGGNSIAFHKKSDAGKLEEIEKCSFEMDIPSPVSKTGTRKIVVLSYNKFLFLVSKARKGVKLQQLARGE
jgi:hypothetical protein